MNERTQPWLDKAQGDWLVLSKLVTDADPAFSDAICFHAQQCVEKLMKAVLLECGPVEPPKIHNLQDLSILVQQLCDSWQTDADALYRLTFAAVQYRYPGDEAEVKDAKWCAETAERLRAKLLDLLGVDPDATPPDPAPG